MLPSDLIEALADSDVERAKEMKGEIAAHPDPWQVHVALFPEVQRVLNPPFINPHLPKMYNICRDFAPHLSRTGIASLVYLELVEYARRNKLDRLPLPSLPDYPVTFGEIEKSIAQKDADATARLLHAFAGRHGFQELTRRMLLLGSAYLEKSLGHSISCTAFILRELSHREAAEAWPALVLLADYFCKGDFNATTEMASHSTASLSRDDLYRSVTGSGFVDIHHTITLYAIERMRSFLSPAEQGHLIAAWVAWLGAKEARLRPVPELEAGTIREYADFKDSFAQLDADALLGRIGGMIARPEDRTRLCAMLVESVCDLYQGNYNPHYLTGLGALLWMLHTHHYDRLLVQNALLQYLGFYFGAMKPKTG